MRLETIREIDAFTIYDAPMPTGKGVLDPIQVFLRDFGGCGQIVVECYGSAWSHWFGAIGSETLRQFIATSHPEYIAEKLLSNTSQPFNKTTRLWVNRIAFAIVEAFKTKGGAA